MPGKLATYRHKRDFRITPEPRGARARSAGPLRFVVQKHAARRLHYDFRLELEDTLKSWAVPKGPSLDPADKRLAVHVEDHPLSYIDFEGVIPPKQYGAGTVEIWDQGQWIPDGNPITGYRAGKLKFHLCGKKLSGGWTLVRTRLTGSGDKEQWLLIKERDTAAQPATEFSVTEALPDSVPRAKPAVENDGRCTRAADRPKKAWTRIDPASLSGAIRAALPETFAPQLATLVESAPAGEAWLYEFKFDGYRILIRVSGKSVRLFTRNGNDWTSKLPVLAQAVKDIGLKNAWLDGEIVATGQNGTPDFQMLQNAFETGHAESIQCYFFDLPYLNGFDLRRAPLVERRTLLRRLLEPHAGGMLRFSDDFAEDPQQILNNACRLSFEGVIGKRRDSSYRSGRSRSWVKLKCYQRQEFVIGGYTEPRGSRTGFGALLLGVHESGGRLRYAGRVGTGFDEKRLQSVHERLEALRVTHSPFHHPPRGHKQHDMHWVAPELVAEVSFAQWTQAGLVRQAVFHGLRADKPAAEIQRERPSATCGGNASARGQPHSRAGGKQVIGMHSNIVAGVRISHPGRVIDKQSGLTKIDLARYYAAVAPWMLPPLKARPVALLRGPEGIHGELFFQKHAEHLSIAGLRILDPKLDPGHAPLMVIDSVATLVGAVQMGAIEFHTWNAVVPSIERPDRFVLDLDPDPSLPWKRVVEAAELTKVLLDELGLSSFLKTSGGKGLHIVVPLIRRHSWDEVLTFTQAIARHLAANIPDRFSAKMGPRNRIKKVFVDYLRNRRGASTVATYSARARASLTVSVPIAWEELGEIEGSNQWDIVTLPARLGRDAWKNYSRASGTLSADMKQVLGARKSIAQRP